MEASQIGETIRKVACEKTDLPNKDLGKCPNICKMTWVFREEDPLLKGQAQLPVYYWLVKKYAVSHAERINAFLSEFERQRARARAQANARARGEEVAISDPALLDYNSWLRTPDDKTKQELMFGLLEERFKRALDQHQTIF